MQHSASQNPVTQLGFNSLNPELPSFFANVVNCCLATLSIISLLLKGSFTKTLT